MLVDGSEERNRLVPNLMHNHKVSFVWDGDLVHDVHYISFDRDRSVGQVDPVELLQDLLEGVHEGVVR